MGSDDHPKAPRTASARAWVVVALVAAAIVLRLASIASNDDGTRLPAVDSALVVMQQRLDSCEAELARVAGADGDGDDDDQIVVASHGSLSLVSAVDGSTTRVLSSGAGVYYGTATDANSVWVAVRASSGYGPNKHGGDKIVRIDVSKSEILEEFEIPSIFSHDAVRLDETTIMVCDTHRGNVVGFDLIKKSVSFVISNLFSRKDHLNSLAVREKNVVLAILHGKNSMSSLAEFSLDFSGAARLNFRIPKIGKMCHGLEKTSKNSWLTLSSGEGTLVELTLGENFLAKREVLYAHPKKHFLKGLVVVDAVAFFSASPRVSKAQRFKSECQLIAFDLRTRKVLWTKESVGVGLINSLRPLIVAPQAPQQQDCTSSFLSDVGKANAQGLSYGFSTKFDLAETPFSFDASKLLDSLYKIEAEFEWTTREDVNNEFILISTMEGKRLDQSLRGPFDFVNPNPLDHAPYLKRVMASMTPWLGRTRLMKLNRRSSVVKHTDNARHVVSSDLNGSKRKSIDSGYWGRRFRVHVPLRTHEDVVMNVAGVNYTLEAGKAYVFANNFKPHYVHNPSNVDRVHLVFDVVGSLELFRSLWTDRAPRRFDSENFLLTEAWRDAPVFESLPRDQVSRVLDSLKATYGVDDVDFDGLDDYDSIVRKALDKHCDSRFAYAVEAFARQIRFECDTVRGPPCDPNSRL